jgi:endonuclease YncB( thermonuclease family)
VRVGIWIVAPVAAAAIIAGGAIWWHVHGSRAPLSSDWDAVEHVADGDTIVVQRGPTVRLVQIDTPEVHGEAECFGEEASADTKHLLPRGTLVHLVRDPATDAVDQYGRLLRYVVREDGMNVNRRLVADGAAAPYFFRGTRGRYAALLMQEARIARAAGRGLWGACPGAVLDPYRGVATG